MPGKAYTMREMKSIVDYLKEHKNYSEMKGRKMWMDFANTRTIDRTWQSLKETFLKRILPDIHNPYYKLTMEEIRSFRQGYDVQERNKNKLEIHTVSDDTANSTGNNNKNEAQPSTSKESEENPGEDIKCSKIQTRNKSSTDTLILENCYETAEDVRRDLESPTKVDKDNENKSTKSFRDYIMYSEPLTPMLQEVIDDFATDDEDPPMQIVEDEVDKPIEEDKQISTSTEIYESQSLITKKPPQATNQAPESGNEKFSKPEASKIKSLKLKKTQKGTWEPKDANTAAVTTSTIVEDDKMEPNNNSENAEDPKNDDTKIVSNTVEKNLVKNDDNSVQLCSNSTTDTQLPNNQEALGKRSSSEKRKSNESPILECQESQNNKAAQKKRRKRSAGKKSRNNSSEKTTETQDKIDKVDTVKSANVSSDNNSKAKGLAVSEVLQELANSEDHEHVDEVENTTEKVQTKENKTGSFIIDASESNPCLKTVSLFDEQFSTSKYIDSESDKEQKTNAESEVVNHDKPSERNAVDKNQSVNSEKPEKQTEKTKATSDPIKNPDQKNIETPEDARSKNLPSAHNINDVVVLKSHSESESDDFEPPLKRRNSIRRTNHSRDRALANVFGFSRGAAIRKRTRSYHDNTASSRYSHRKRTLSRNVTNKVESGSSDEYTTASESEDLSPVRNRRNGLISMQKYVKPESFNILSNPNGELFVVGRKKIYPIIMRNGTAANFACWPESDDDTDNSYWKLKYVEEKKRAAEEKIRADELARLLDRANERQKARDATSIGLEAQSLTPTLEKVQRQKETDDDNKKSEEKSETSKEERGQEKTVKIKFTKNNEIELECQWPHFQPVLEKMAKMFHKNVDESTNNDKSKQQKPEQVTESKLNDSSTEAKAKEPETEAKAEKPEPKRTRKSSTANKSAKSLGTGSKTSLEPVVEVSSGKSTPVNSAEVRQKVDKLESEIFKEIEERDKTETNIDKTEDQNVTTRKRGRPRKQSTLSLSVSHIESAAKEMPAEKEIDQAAEIIEKSIKTHALSDSGTAKRQTRAPKRYNSDTSSSVTMTRKEKMNQSAPSKSEIEVHIPEDDSAVRYMLPPRSRSRSEARKAAKTANKETSKSYPTQTPKILSSPDTSSRHSIDSTQGYQDSDNSLPNLSLKRKKKTSLSGFSIRRNRSKIRRKSYPYLGDDDSNEAEYPSSLPAKLSYENSSVNTEVYTSESYRLLLPPTKTFRQLHKIDENAIDAEPTARFRSLSPITINIYNDFEENSGETIENKIDFPNTLSGRSGEGNSSSVSLPLSPELSIVEKLSISKEILGSVEDHPTINEMQGNNSSTQSTDYNKYLISDVDISVPLMEQDCELRQSLRNNANKPTVTESLLDQIGTVNIEQSSSDSLDQKLGDLLLESAKKMVQQMQVDVVQDNAMDVKATVPKEKKTRAKKRSSTPLKRKNLKKSKEPAIEPVVEEHVETCSKAGRKSCPPIINVTNVESGVNITDHAQNISTESIYSKGSRRKKDIIKVKILKPKEKKVKRSSSSRNSVCTDSGINEESEMFLQECNDSVELIHNHSETCLHANECIGDSVEFVENSKSVISLNSNSGILHDKCPCEMNDRLEELISPELFCNNAQDATSLNNAIKPAKDDVDTASTGTIFHSLNSYASFNSLLTEDMSNETPNPPQENAPKSKWYLLSEDETNTNFVDAFSQNNCRGSGSNLKQIFPVACAVPNLSTISEMSKENNSTKPVDTDVDTGNFSESSLFNSFV